MTSYYYKTNFEAFKHENSKLRMKKIFEKFRNLSETEKAEVNDQFNKAFEDFKAKSKKFLESLPEKRMVDLNYYRTKILKKESIEKSKSSVTVASNIGDLLSNHDDDVKEIEEDDEDEQKKNHVADEEEKASVYSQSSNSSMILNNQSLEVFISKSAKRPEK